MGRSKESMMDHEDDGGYLQFFEALLDEGEIDPESKLGARLRDAIDQQEPSLITADMPEELQSYLECKRCGDGPIPASELTEAVTNGGYCGYCAHAMDKDD